MKSWDPVWDDIYRSREWGKYPPEELIRFVARRYYGAADRSQLSILDLGCGVGSASWYLCREGFSVTAFDGSAAALEHLDRRLRAEGLSARLVQGDAMTLPFADRSFDCVIDLACLMCNSEPHAQAMVGEIWRTLKPGGSFFSLTPQTGCWGDGLGTPLGDHTYRDAGEGPFAGMGTVRFLPETGIAPLYGRFASRSVDYLKRSVQGMGQELAFWSIACEKAGPDHHTSAPPPGALPPDSHRDRLA